MSPRGTFMNTKKDGTKGLRGIRCKAKPAHFDAKQADLPVQEQGPVLWREIYQMEPKPQVTCGSPTALGAIYRFLSSVSRRLQPGPGGSGFFHGETWTLNVFWCSILMFYFNDFVLMPQILAFLSFHQNKTVFYARVI